MTTPAALDRIVNVVLACAAAIAAAVLVKREFMPSKSPNRSARYDKSWVSYQPEGRTSKAMAPKINVTVLSDFECPACAAFEAAFRAFRRKHGASVSYTFIHFPLSYHQNALRTANAAECAAEQGKFFEMHDALFEVQRSLSTISYDSLARAVGVPDTASFRNCRDRPDTAELVKRGLALGAQIGLTGTPTVFVNGWRFSSSPTLAQLDSAWTKGKTPDRPRR